MLHPAFFWVHLALQSEGFALIALSYYYKDSSAGPRLGARDIAMILIPFAMVAVPFILPTSEIAGKPYFNYAQPADFSLYMCIFNMAVLGFIF